MSFRCLRNGGLGITLAAALTLVFAAGTGYAQTPPVVDGNIDDLISFADAIDGTNLGCGITATTPADDICTDNSDVLIPCSELRDVACGIHFDNGYDLTEWAIARDGQTGITYLGIRVDGVIGDADGDGTDGTDNPGACVQTPTITDPPGISSGEDYTWAIDTDCVGGADIFISVIGGAGTGIPTVRVRDALENDIPGIGATSAQYVGSDLEVSIAGLSLPPIFRVSAFVGASGAVPDGLAEDGDGPLECRIDPDLNITKTADPSVLCPGETTTFSILVENTGGIDLTVTVSDELPAGLNFAGNVGGSCGVTAQVNGQNITFTDFELAAGQSCTITFDATADEACFGEVLNVAQAVGVYEAACLGNGGIGQIGPVEDDALILCNEPPCVDNVDCEVPDVACDGQTIEVSGSARNCSDGAEDITINLFGPGGLIDSQTFNDVPSGQTVSLTAEVTHNCPEGQDVVYYATATAENECGGTDEVRSPDCTVECGVEPCVEAICETSVTEANIGDEFDVTGSATNCSEGPEDITLWLMGPTGQLGLQETFNDVPAGSTVTIVRSFVCEEPGVVMFRAMAEAENECGDTSDQSDNECSVDCQETGFCWMTSGGNYSGNDSKGQKFWTWGGNVGPPPSGNWQHHEFDGDGNTLFNFHAMDVEVITCFNDGTDGPCHPDGEFNVIIFGGSGEYSIGNGKKTEEATFRVQAEDHGEPGNTPDRDGGCGSPDVYEITVWDSDLNVLFSHREFVEGGNIQIHPLKENQLRRIRSGGGRSSLRPSGPGGGADKDVSVGDDVYDGEYGLSLQLYQPAPNPFNNTTRIAYAISDGVSERVEIGIYNIAGRKVRTLVSGFQTAGRYEVTWDAVDNHGVKVSPGVYFVSGSVAGQKIPITRVVYTR